MKLHKTRRTFLIAAGCGIGIAADRYSSNSTSLDKRSFEETFAVLINSMSDTQLGHTFKSEDHPARQMTNTIPVHSGPHIGTLFSDEQQLWIKRLYASMLSVDGLSMFHNTVNLEGKLAGSNFTVYGDHKAPIHELQAQINGGHYMLRKGLESKSGYAFGGPIAYGQQIGNGRFMVEGNAFKPHGDALHRLHKSLTNEQKRAAYIATPPSELDLQPLGDPSLIPGLSMARISGSAKQAVTQLLHVIFTAYTKEQASSAWSALDQHGGLDALHLSMFTDYGFYNRHDRYDKNNKATPYIQVWRLEGPHSVIHFKGYPHVHGYINILHDVRKRNVGRTLTFNHSSKQSSGIKELWQKTLRSYTGLPLSFYSAKPNGRLPRGEVTTGSVYCIEPFDNDLVIVDINVPYLNAAARATLLKQGANLNNAKLRIATYDYLLESSDEIGVSTSVIDKVIERGPSLRSIMIEQLAMTPYIPT
ncbi:hypothetical protein NBRC116583_19960 [Arenicella sp. 4NH20-0111]|uniref:DUF3500 domain-containing protein n=1 Tax=Arenicella sp. 4NH20-0111 TaxID=3127648 RepID=UPI00310B5E3F